MFLCVYIPFICIFSHRIDVCLCVCVRPQEDSSPRGVDSCPRVWALQGSPLVPVGFDKELYLLGKNLDMFEVTQYTGVPHHTLRCPATVLQYTALYITIHTTTALYAHSNTHSPPCSPALSPSLYVSLTHTHTHTHTHTYTHIETAYFHFHHTDTDLPHPFSSTAPRGPISPSCPTSS